LTIGVQHGEVTAGVVHRPLVGVAHDHAVEVHLVLFVGGPQLLTLGGEDEGQLLLADHEQDRRTLEVGVEASKARFTLPEGLAGGRIVQKMAVLAVGADQERAAHRTDAYTLAVVEHVVHVRALLQRLAAVRGRLSLCADQAAAAKWWLSMPMASVSAEGPMPKALSTRRTSPLMPGCRHQGRACPLRRARMTSNPLIVA